MGIDQTGLYFVDMNRMKRKMLRIKNKAYRFISKHRKPCKVLLHVCFVFFVIALLPMIGATEPLFMHDLTPYIDAMNAEREAQAAAEALLADRVPPELSVPERLEVFPDETVSYKDKAVLTDNLDPAPVLEVDASAVRLQEEGRYPVFYTATDAAGNTATAVMTLVVTGRDTAVMQEELETIVAETAGRLVTDDMTDTEKARAIYDYVRYQIAYAPQAAERDLVSAGYRGFTKQNGDCYINYACAKLLLDYCGIPNVDVERVSEDGSSHHYWLLVDTGSGWYHYDASPSSENDYFYCFMKTDAELEEYCRTRSDGRRDYYTFDHELYAAYPRATEPYHD